MRNIGIAIIFLVFGHLAYCQDVVISEILAVNNRTIMSPSGKFTDYVELMNSGKSRIDLTGYYLSDDKDKPTQYKLPTIVLKPGEAVLLWADGKPENGNRHLPFKLSSKGETVYLYSPSATLVHKVKYKKQFDDISFGLSEKSEKAVYQIPTPGKPNVNQALLGIRNDKTPLQISLDAEHETAKIHWKTEKPRTIRMIVANKNKKPLYKEKQKGNSGTFDLSQLENGKYILVLSRNYYKIIKQSTL